MSCLNDYRPVALTSVPMKTFEGLILNYLKSLLPSDFDPFQFAYRPNRSVEDAIAIWLHEVLAHLEKKCSYARILFIDFSSAFNTIIPAKLHFKLLHHLKFPVAICDWILDFLLCRKQIVRIGSTLSSAIELNTGTPQGCVLSPLLFSLFTYDCSACDPNSRLIKFADDTTVSGLILKEDESGYRREVDLLTKWCSDNNLILNVNKTKELIVDFRKIKNTKEPLFINGICVEQVNVFKLLGTSIMDNLLWSTNTEEIVKKGRQRLSFLRIILKSFGISRNILVNFYQGIIESILTTNILVWFGNLNQKDLRKLDTVIRSAERIIGTKLPDLHTLYQKRALKRINGILIDHTHPAGAYLNFLPSGKRLQTFKGCKRFTESFYPSVIKFFNLHQTR